MEDAAAGTGPRGPAAGAGRPARVVEDDDLETAVGGDEITDLSLKHLDGVVEAELLTGLAPAARASKGLLAVKYRATAKASGAATPTTAAQTRRVTLSGRHQPGTFGSKVSANGALRWSR